MDQYSEFVYKSRYARYLPDEGRRENWHETVSRYLDFFEEKFPKQVRPVRDKLYQHIFEMQVAPSMRCVMTSGPALERDNAAGYNCAYLAVNSLRSFDEAFYLLLCGTGVGFSVERQEIGNLPEVAGEHHNSESTINVRDSKMGWASALKECISLAWGGTIPQVDYSRVRPSGAILRTFGGRASGPEPLRRCIEKVVSIVKGAAGRKINSLEAHDIMCAIAESVVVGGVRRAAMISLSNLTDQRMALAKSGDWHAMNPQRALANNSIAFSEKPDVGAFMREWGTIYESKSGERGIFNREAAKALSPERRNTEHSFGTNPCSEILLRDRQLCNLSEVIARPSDGYNELAGKIEVATILGSLQSCLTDFRYLSSKWKANCEEERLLGVSITGIYDNKFLLTSSPEELKKLKQVAVDTNVEWAKKLKINASTAITCVKPSGSVSQLVDSASGIHPRYARTYWRRIRNDNKDPITAALIEAGVPHEQDIYNSEATVFTFAKSAPRLATVTDDVTAIQHLEMWKHFALNWCEHKPSVTINVAESEWPEVGAWCWENFDILSGVSFLPKEDDAHSYQQAPYERCTAEEFKAYPKLSPVVWDEVNESLNKQTEFACSAGVCEI